MIVQCGKMQYLEYSTHVDRTTVRTVCRKKVHLLVLLGAGKATNALS